MILGRGTGDRADLQHGACEDPAVRPRGTPSARRTAADRTPSGQARGASPYPAQAGGTCTSSARRTTAHRPLSRDHRSGLKTHGRDSSVPFRASLPAAAWKPLLSRTGFRHRVAGAKMRCRTSPSPPNVAVHGKGGGPTVNIHRTREVAVH